MKKLIYLLFTLPLLFPLTELVSRSGGPAAILNQDRTGSPVSTGTCGSAGCHSGGNFNPGMTLTVKDGLNNPVTTYTPGETYTLTWTGNATGTPPSAWGMQCVPLLSNNNAGGSLSNPGAGSHITNLSGRQYFEHSTPSNSNTFTAKWVAPAQSSGNVTFYFMALAANGNTQSSGDQASASLSLVVNEACSPFNSTVNDTFCEGSFYFFDGNNLTAGGTYFDTIPGAGGCDTFVQLNLIMDSLANISFNVPIPPYCVDMTNISLSALPNGGTFTGPGVSGSNFDPSQAGIGTHQILYTYTGSNGCTTVDSIPLEVTSCTGIHDADIFPVKIFPVTEAGQIRIEGLENGMEIEVFDLSGSTLYRGKADGPIMNATVNGSYLKFVRISFDGKIQVMRVPRLR